MYGVYEFEILMFFIIPIIAGVIAFIASRQDYNSIGESIMWGLVGTFVMWVLCLMILGCMGFSADIDDARYYGEHQTFSLNAVPFVFDEGRYVYINIPNGFYGRIEILNTETRRSLFSTAIEKQVVYSKDMIPLSYKIDTNYIGDVNQFTIEIQNNEINRYESHVYTIRDYDCRPTNGTIFTGSKRVKVVYE